LNILFLCSSLEPGRDGVGDYTRRLAIALQNIGLCVKAVALNDRTLAKESPVREDIQTTFEGNLEVWRFSSQKSWKRRIACLQQLITQFKPDWLSLQFVPYGYHDKGLPFLLPSRLGALKGSFQWHIMFHELAVGLDGHASARQSVIQVFQKLIIKALIRELSPNSINSHAALYIQTLLTLGYATASPLALFGSIENQVKKSGLDIISNFQPNLDIGKNRERYHIAIVFGAVYPNWNPSEFILKWKKALDKTNKNAMIVFVGRGLNSSHSSLLEDISRRVIVIQAGEQDSQSIAALLLDADFGLATTPLSLIEKSSAAATYRDFGLPVVVIREDFEQLPPMVPPPLLASKIVMNEIVQLHRQSVEPNAMLKHVRDTFLANLQSRA